MGWFFIGIEKVKNDQIQLKYQRPFIYDIYVEKTKWKLSTIAVYQFIV